MGQAMILLLLIAALVPRMLTAQNLSGVRSSRSDAALKSDRADGARHRRKDEKYQRPQTSGFAAMIAGIAALRPTDEQRIEEGGRLLEATGAALKAARL